MTLIKEDAIQKKLTMNANNKRYYSEEYIKGWEDGVRDQYNATMPTNDNWIPVSERLPSESGDYLCTIPLDADETYTEVLTFHKGRFYEDDDEWGATYHDDVIAWIQLPKPYREENEE